MSVDAAELRRGIGYVIQQAGLFPHRTILDNIATVPLLLGWSKAKARARAAELMEIVGLAPEMAQRYPAQLSGGQQQRVGVARALAADPPILLMDEPFSAVDPVVRESLQDELLRLQSELGKTIVFVTHDIDEADQAGRQGRGAAHRRRARAVRRAGPAARPAGRRLRRRLRRARPRLPRPRLPVLRRHADRRAAHRRRWASRCRPTTPGCWSSTREQRPQGWLNGAERNGATVVGAEHLVPGGSLYDIGSGSLRSALDAALSSPSGVGVAVDADGAVVGSVSADDVLAVVDAVREHEAAA